jgi:hypothetical protein
MMTNSVLSYSQRGCSLQLAKRKALHPKRERRQKEKNRRPLRLIPFYFGHCLILPVEMIIEEKGEKAAQGQADAETESDQALTREGDHRVTQSQNDPGAIENKIELLVFLIRVFVAEREDDFEHGKQSQKSEQDAPAIRKDARPLFGAISKEGSVPLVDRVNRAQKESDDESKQEDRNQEFKNFFLHQ